MKKILTLLTVFCGFLTAYSADLYVNEFGTGGAYSTVSAALSAASSGDRILIQPKSGNASYVENLSISNPVQLLCTDNNSQWTLTGNVTFGTVTAGGLYVISGMNNLSGTLTCSTGPTSGNRANLKFMGCDWASTVIDVSGNNMDVQFAGCNITHSGSGSTVVSLKNADMFGCTVSFSGSSIIGISVATDATSGSDSCLFVANRIVNTSSTSSPNNMFYWNSTSHYYVLLNNFFKMATSGSYTVSNAPVNFNTSKSGSGYNAVINNTVVNTASSPQLYYGLYFYNSQNSPVNVYNNLINGAIAYPIYRSATSNNFACSYNGYSGTWYSSSITNDGTNFSYSGGYNSTTGAASTSNNGWNHPAMYDLDLTRNDIGTYGGSFSFTNYFSQTGSTRIYWVDAPRSVIQNNTIYIKADGWDR